MNHISIHSVDFFCIFRTFVGNIESTSKKRPSILERNLVNVGLTPGLQPDLPEGGIGHLHEVLGKYLSHIALL